MSNFSGFEAPGVKAVQPILAVAAPLQRLRLVFLRFPELKPFIQFGRLRGSQSQKCVSKVGILRIQEYNILWLGGPWSQNFISLFWQFSGSESQIPYPVSAVAGTWS